MRFDRKNIMIPRPQCFCCKSSLEIYRNSDNEDVIYFDKHYYHKKCFVEMNKIIKKCYQCSNDIDFCCNDDELIYYDKHYYHKECFIQWCHATKTASKKRKMAFQNIDNYIVEAKQQVTDLMNTKRIGEEDISRLHNEAVKRIEKWFDESDLCNFIREEYDVSVVPWRKLSQVLNGTYPNLQGAIPAKYLLDMWKRKLDFLRKQNDKLVSHSDKERTKDNIIHYDLSILVNKYDSYLKWLEKQKIIEAESIKSDLNKTKISTSIINSKANESSKWLKNEDISDLVDDIFED